MTVKAEAYPTKRFFISNLTRDLSLEDAILDLVDNSIDAYIKSRKIDISARLLSADSDDSLLKTAPEKADIRVRLDENRFEIEDRGGGIDFDHARKNVFRMGRVDPQHQSSLGVYGIGLKRAMFKLGDTIEVESRTTKTGFTMSVKVSKWSADDRPESWTFPLTRTEPARSIKTAGTRITVTDLSEEVRLRLRSPQLIRRIEERIASSYTLFLDRHLSIALNDKLVRPSPLPIATSETLGPGFRTLKIGLVECQLIAGLAQRKSGEWSTEDAGWYVLCNGRVVVSADKTELTGWGTSTAQYVSKYRGFVGIAFFFSDQPSELPWTTTKRGLNQDSEAYQLARAEMTVLTRPVLSFLNNMYPSEPAEEITERRLADELEPADIRTVVASSPNVFRAPVRVQKKAKTTVKVQFDAELTDIKKVQKRINRPRWGAGAIGRYCLEYFLKAEVPE